MGYLHDMCEGQGHRSKFRVTRCGNVIFSLDKNSYLLFSIWSIGTKFGMEVDVGHFHNIS